MIPRVYVAMVDERRTSQRYSTCFGDLVEGGSANRKHSYSVRRCLKSECGQWFWNRDVNVPLGTYSTWGDILLASIKICGHRKTPFHITSYHLRSFAKIMNGGILQVGTPTVHVNIVVGSGDSTHIHTIYTHNTTHTHIYSIYTFFILFR
eukprot:Rmarinus@m.13369